MCVCVLFIYTRIEIYEIEETPSFYGPGHGVIMLHHTMGRWDYTLQRLETAVSRVQTFRWSDGRVSPEKPWGKKWDWMAINGGLMMI